MSSKQIIQTPDAPAALGTYSQAVRVNDPVNLTGQIGLDPSTMQMAESTEGQIHRVFLNLRAVALAGVVFGAKLDDLGGRQSTPFVLPLGIAWIALIDADVGRRVGECCHGVTPFRPCRTPARCCVPRSRTSR